MKVKSILTHGSNDACPRVKDGSWGWCKGHEIYSKEVTEDRIRLVQLILDRRATIYPGYGTRDIAVEILNALESQEIR